MFYTGVGSRETPTNICSLMTSIATYLRICLSLTLRSGGAIGADKAFEAGAGNLKEIYFKQDATQEAMTIAGKFHPVWNALRKDGSPVVSDFAKRLHGRNPFQVLGRNLATPSDFLICWTPDGCTTHATRKYETGGTGTAISIASANAIPVHNLRNEATFNIWQKYIEESKEWADLNLKLSQGAFK